ncbi:MAG: hypothetical protein JNM00_02640 [Flavobacteriales bacterium]|nr:hypothetical protein [Flavobacteriales bacterium]
MKGILAGICLLMVSLSANAQKEGTAVLLDGNFRPQNDRVSIKLLVDDSYSLYRVAVEELATENASILEISEEGSIVLISISARSGDRNAWYKIFSVMGIEIVEVDTGEQEGINEMGIEELMNYYQVD